MKAQASRAGSPASRAAKSVVKDGLRASIVQLSCPVRLALRIAYYSIGAHARRNPDGAPPPARLPSRAAADELQCWLVFKIPGL